MIDFWRDLFGRPGASRTVILLEPDSMSAPRQYEVRTGHAVYAAIIATVGLGALLVAAAVLTPLRGLLVGPGAGELRVVAERNAARASALEDSLAAQDEQVDLLRALITGDPASETAGDDAPNAAAENPAPGVPAEVEAPAAPVGDAEPERRAASSLTEPADRYLAGLRTATPLPLDGVVSRAFAPARGHFGLDLAADTGTPVQSVGAGTVVLSDWTQAGGLTVAVQHPGGYLVVYQHNSRLLRRPGDRVTPREVLALSGNTGEVTSGPHLHVEVWRDGRAVDPASFFLTR